MICASVPVFKLYGLSAVCKSKHLVAKTYSKNRELAVFAQFLKLSYDSCILLRVSRSVRKHYSVHIHFFYLLKGSVVGNNFYSAAAPLKLTLYVCFCAKVKKSDSLSFSICKIFCIEWSFLWLVRIF